MSECSFCKMKRWDVKIGECEYSGLCSEEELQGEEGTDFSIVEITGIRAEEYGTKYTLCGYHDVIGGESCLYEEALPIFYCPICGRKLNDESKG